MRLGRALCADVISTESASRRRRRIEGAHASTHGASSATRGLRELSLCGTAREDARPAARPETASSRLCQSALHCIDERWVSTHRQRPACLTKTHDTRSARWNGSPWYLPPDAPRASTTATSP